MACSGVAHNFNLNRCGLYAFHILFKIQTMFHCFHMFSHCFTVSALWTLVTGSCSGQGTSCPWSSCQTYESDSASRSSSHNSLRNAKIRWYMVVQRVFVDLFDMALWNPLTLTNHTEPDTPPTVCKIRLWCTTNHHTISLSQPCKDIHSISLTFFHLSPSMLQPALRPFHQEPFGHSRDPSRSSRPSEPATMGLWHPQEFPQALWTSSQHSQLWSKHIQTRDWSFYVSWAIGHFYAAIIPAPSMGKHGLPPSCDSCGKARVRCRFMNFEKKNSCCWP